MISLPAGLAFKIAMAFLKKNWRAFVVAAVLGSALWIFLDWRGQKELLAAQRYELKTERELTRKWRDVSRLQSAKALESARLRAEVEARLADLLSRPPEIITIIGDAVDDVPAAVGSDTACEDAISGLAELMRGIDQ